MKLTFSATLSSQPNGGVPALRRRMTNRSDLILATVLRVMRPLVALLLRHGVAYPAFSSAMKRVFLDAARAELQAQGMPMTDSALTLLSGVPRGDPGERQQSATGQRACHPEIMTF